MSEEICPATPAEQLSMEILLSSFLFSRSRLLRFPCVVRWCVYVAVAVGLGLQMELDRFGFTRDVTFGRSR